ncbi:hypothetical protein AAMO2058_001748300 [Amorphochlora amoebiformis]
MATRVFRHARRGFSSLRVLVVDAYAPDGREQLARGGMTSAGELYARMLRRHSPVEDIEPDIVFAADDDFKPPCLDEYDGVAWTGSSLTIYSQEPRVNQQIQFSRDIFEKGVPQFGSCWALQIAVCAAGGECSKNPRGREVVFSRKMTLTPDGRAHPMFEGKTGVFDGFTSHDDEATHMPPGGLILAGNAHTAIQAASIEYKNGTFWSVQYHPEYDMTEIARLTDIRRQMLINQGFFEDDSAVDRYVEMLDQLHKEPFRKDLAWQLGVDHDTLDENFKCLEVKNWLSKQVLPYHKLRRKK